MTATRPPILTVADLVRQGHARERTLTTVSREGHVREETRFEITAAGQRMLRDNQAERVAWFAEHPEEMRAELLEAFGRRS